MKNEKFEKLYEKAYKSLIPNRQTLVSPERLRNCGACVLDVIENNVEGDIVECGVFKGGTLSFMALANQSFSNSSRKVWGFDTFSGIPKPTNKDGVRAQSRGTHGDLFASEDQCKENLERLGVDIDNVVLVKGLFQDTLEITKDKIQKISVLRLDGDWYDSTKICLEELYDLVQVGGWIIIDDYGHWEGCKKAVDEFLSLRNIRAQIKKTDYTEICWKKLD